MRAIRYRDGQVWLDTSAPAPSPGAGEALVRVTHAGISGADLAVCRGVVAFEGVLGHECVGVVQNVDQLAEGDRDTWAGARVVLAPEVVCGRCDLCRSGLSAHCRERTVFGLKGRDGCLCEQVAAPVRNLVALPDEITDIDGVLAPSVAVAMHAAQVISLEGKAYVTVLGDDVVALLCAQVMQRLNASVRVLGQRADALRLCEQWGLKHRHVGEAGRRQDQDVVVVCETTRECLSTAAGMVRPRGKVLVVGATGVGDAGDADLTPLVANELEAMGVRGGSVADAVASMASGAVNVIGLATRRTTLDVAALRAAGDALKVVVDI